MAWMSNYIPLFIWMQLIIHALLLFLMYLICVGECHPKIQCFYSMSLRYILCLIVPITATESQFACLPSSWNIIHSQAKPICSWILDCMYVVQICANMCKYMQNPWQSPSSCKFMLFVNIANQTYHICIGDAGSTLNFYRYIKCFCPLVAKPLPQPK